MYLQADLDWLIEMEKQYPQENYIFFIHDKIEAIKHANKKEWAEYIDLFKDRIKKYDYNLALNEIKALPENRERIHKIAGQIRQIQLERQYIKDELYYNNFITKFQNLCPRQNYQATIDTIGKNIAEWNLLSINLYIQEIEDMITIFPNRTGELENQIKRLKKLTPAANINEYMTNYSVPFEDDFIQALHKMKLFLKDFIEKATDETPFLFFFASKEDFRKNLPKESFHLVDFICSSLRDSNGYTKQLNVKSSTLTSFNIHLQVKVPHYILFYLSELQKKYSPNYTQKIFEILSEKMGFLEPCEREALEIILTYGFYNNFIVTSYMIPAFCEKLFTKILLSKGFDLNIAKGDLIERKQMTTYFNPESKEYKCLMNAFEESDLYDLYMLLIVINFRNDLYHGKEDPNLTKSHIAVYLWYVFGRLILCYKGLF